MSKLGATETIHVQLSVEGAFIARPIQALPLGKGLYMVLATPDYDPAKEQWEFPPGSTVRTAPHKSPTGETYPLAVKP